MKKNIKNLGSAAAIALSLVACGTIDTTTLENVKQEGQVNQGEDKDIGNIVIDDKVYSADEKGNTTLVDELSSLQDIDKDGTADIMDDDIDGDGTKNTEDSDIDGDGKLNTEDDDIDGDGIKNIDDNDIDGDGIKNTDDDDIDGDGIKNTQDDDIDSDGFSNKTDNDVDGDGIINSEDDDVDGDGVKNSEDNDVDGDGVDNSQDNDVDGDGIINDNDDDVDGDGITNDDDDDIDGDGVKNDDETNDDVDGNVSVTANNTEVLNVGVKAGSITSTTTDVLDFQDIRDEIAANDMELGTVVVTDFKVTLEDADDLIADIGDAKADMKFYLDGKLVFIGAPDLTLNDVAEGVSLKEGELAADGGQLSALAAAIRSNEVESQEIELVIVLDEAPSGSHDIKIKFDIESNGKVEI